MKSENSISKILQNSKLHFFFVAIVLLAYMLINSRTAGISGDEYFKRDYAELVYKFIESGGKDTSYIMPELPLQKYNGQSFDNLIYIINKKLNIEDYYASRHFFNSFSGWLLILFTGLITSLIFGWRAGMAALILMFFSPKILGHSWNNPKDIPFATTYIVSLYFLLAFISKLPKINKRDLLFLTLGIASAIGIRIGGLILIPYLFLFSGFYYLTQKSFYSKHGFIRAIKTFGILSAVSIIGYLLGLILWPYGLVDPIHNPVEALKEMTNYDIGLNQLFEGTITLSKDLPWYYGLKYILISSPLIVFIGLILFGVTLFIRKNKRVDYLFYSFILFAFAFPIAYTIFKNSNLYGGWRHLLWTYSPLIVISAGGFEYFLSKKNKYLKYGTLAVIITMLAHPAIHTFKNHPYQYVYYNQLVGGTKEAFGKYEMDYYYHSLREGAEWLIDHKVGKDTITVATNHYRITNYYFRNYPQVKVVYSRYYERSREDWDYAIWANTHITPSQLDEGYWPPKETIHTMDVDGMPIGAVVKRVSHEDYIGFEALKKRQRELAQKHFRNFLKVYPENEEVLEGYARTMLMQRNYDSTIVYANKSLKYNPRELGALLLIASAHNNKKEFQEAYTTANEMTELKEDFAEGHYHKGYALKHLNKPNDALKEFQKALNYKKDYYQAYYQMGEILCNYKNYKKAIEIYSKVLEKRDNDFIATVNTARNQYLTGDEQKAQEILDGISKNRQNRLEVVSLKCRIALDKNDLTAAANYLNMARNINYSSNLSVLRARFYIAQNDRQNAEKFLAQAVEQDATNREANELLKSLKSTQTAQQSTTTKEEKPTESIMFQQPKKKKPNPLGLRSRK